METQLIVFDDNNSPIALDTFQLDPIKVNLSFEDIVNTAITSNYSQTFRLPSSEANYQFFQTAFDVDGYDFDVTKKVSSSIQLDGGDFIKGHLRLLKIFNRGNDSAEYECVFMGEVRDFAGKLSDKTIGDIDWSDYNHELNYDNVVLSWDATADTTNGLMNGDIIYPLVNFGNIYDQGIPTEGVMQVGGTYGFTSSSQAIDASRFRPMVRMPEVFRRVMDESGFEYESNFLESETAKKMYVSAWGNEPRVNIVGGSANNFEASPSTILSYSSTSDIEYGNEIYDYANNYNPATSVFTAPADGTYNFNVAVLGNIDAASPAHSFAIQVLRDATVIASQTFTGSTLVSQVFGYVNYFISVAMTAGQTLSVKYSQNNSGSINVSAQNSVFRCVNSTGDINIASQFETEYKQVDFIRDIMTLFHLVMVPHPFDSDKFVIEPFEDFINAGYHSDDADYERVWDITDKIDYDKDVVIEPTFYSQKRLIDFTYAEDKDWLNDLNTKEFKETFGTLKSFSNNELLEGERKVEVKLGATPVTQIDNSFTTGAGMGNTIIPHIITKDSNDTGVQNKPIKAKTRLLFYNGIKFCGLGVDYDQSVWYFEDDTSTAQAYDYYPRVSPYFNSPITPNALDLNWQREVGYALYPVLTGQEVSSGVSLYDRYWANYIDSLYDKWGRKVVVTAYLRPSDLTYPTFYWDKIVKVKGSYYRLDKIEGFNVSNPDFCKIHLIKLENPNLDYAEVAQLIWNEWTEAPDTVTENWGSL